MSFLGSATPLALATLVLVPWVGAESYEYSTAERLLLTRDLTASYATAKLLLPRSRTPLPLDPAGVGDSRRWLDAHGANGPAAARGDLVQITRVDLEKKRIVFQINGGFNGGRRWWDRIQVGVGASTRPIEQQQQVGAQPVGTVLALEFPDGVPQLEAFEIKEMLSSVLDFEQRSAAEQYIDTLPAPIRAAVEENRAVEGMDQDAVLLALGKPVRKVRETSGGIEYEDWVYGEPPGRITFVKFHGGIVVEVREAYAGLGGSTMPPLPAQQ
jgi:hypothetical protein